MNSYTIQGKNVSDVDPAVDVFLKIVEFANFARTTHDMAVLARRSNVVYVGNVVNYKAVLTQFQVYHHLSKT